MNKKIYTKFIGCRLNQYEIEYIQSQLESYGFISTKNIKEASLCIVNTCTVTGKADKKSKNAIKKIIRENPDAFLVVTGCFAQTDSHVLKNIKGIDLIVPNSMKENLVDILKEKGIVPDNKIVETEYIPPRSRPYIKIQDGCNHFCSYCKVRIARGKSRSVDFNEIIKKAKKLGERGYKEIVLTGINIGDYHWEGKRLSHLIKELCNLKEVYRLRLSSIEPMDLTDDLLEAVSHPKVCRHLHIPLQSGSDRILKLMRRNYTAEMFKNKIIKLKKIKPEVTIGTDVIVGFPTETEEDFCQTFNLLKELDIFYLHVFRYSPREGTEAAKMKNDVPEEVKIKRSKILKEYREKRKKEFFNSLIGKEYEVIIEKKLEDGYYTSLSDNYLVIYLPVEQCKNKDLAIAKIERVENNKLYGKVLKLF